MNEEIPSYRFAPLLKGHSVSVHIEGGPKRALYQGTDFAVPKMAKKNGASGCA